MKCNKNSLLSLSPLSSSSFVGEIASHMSHRSEITCTKVSKITKEKILFAYDEKQLVNAEGKSLSRVCQCRWCSTDRRLCLTENTKSADWVDEIDELVSPQTDFSFHSFYFRSERRNKNCFFVLLFHTAGFPAETFKNTFICWSNSQITYIHSGMKWVHRERRPFDSFTPKRQNWSELLSLSTQLF